ncbi:MAG: 4-(cytidine 5'-diphospho)-2-C-methyl-D-erythritol kinase [Bacillota bacterium]|nr:4-(cytidine 5'-diphospho)-2-C-methyl-D-erythritol kinase [Bacillota bacterium]
MKTTVYANAKVNLTLDITGKREDSYHTIRTVMHNIELSDEIEISFIKKGIRITSNLYYLPSGPNNIAYKAAEAFLKEINMAQGLEIRLHKKIPVGGGLGGSSTDGAAVLRGLNNLFSNPISEKRLLQIAASLGSDMPFCLTGGAALCEGVGEIITPLPDFCGESILIVKPPFSLNTKVMYEQIDAFGIANHPKTDEVVEAFRQSNFKEVTSNLFNVFEPVAIAIQPIIGVIKEKLLKFGAIGALMSGSGSSVYGIFKDEASAFDAEEKLKFEKFDVYFSKLCK